MRFPSWRSRVEVGCGDDERSWAQSRTLYNTGFHRCNRRAFPGISRTVKVLFKERLYPVVDVVGDIRLGHLVHQSLMPDGVERLCKVKRKDVDVLVGRQHLAYSVKQSYDRGCC